MPPLWVQLWSFHSSRFYCLTCGDLKKKKMEGRDIKGEREGVEQERRERKKVLKERKNNNKELILRKERERKKKQAYWFQTGEASFAGLFGCSQLRGPSPALLHSKPALRQPPAQLSSTQLSSGPWTHRFRHSPSSRLWVHAHGAFRDAHSPQFLWSQVPPSCTLPGALDLGCGSTKRPRGEETGAATAGEFPKMPPRVFFFLRKSSCSILPLHSRKGLSSHTAHLSS